MTQLTRLLLPVVVVLLTAWPAAAATLIGTCVRVADGDTLTVELAPSGKRETIRLLGIDTPEVAHGPRDPGQEPWGSRAAAFTRKLCLGQQVRIETDVQPRDRYRRLLGYVYVGPTFVNLELVKAGHAVTLTYPPNVAHADEFVAAQRQAREAGRGIWDDQEPLPQSPHDYRRRDKGRTPPQRKGAGERSPQPVRPGPGAAARQDLVLINGRSRVYHEPGCRHANGRNLREVSRAEAEASGRPCKVCH